MIFPYFLLFQRNKRSNKSGGQLLIAGEEAAYIRAHFAAVVLPMEPEEGKSWYEITFRGAEN